MQTGRVLRNGSRYAWGFIHNGRIMYVSDATGGVGDLWQAKMWDHYLDATTWLKESGLDYNSHIAVEVSYVARVM